jgi:hypothetical protein
MKVLGWLTHSLKTLSSDDHDDPDTVTVRLFVESRIRQLPDVPTHCSDDNVFRECVNHPNTFIQGQYVFLLYWMPNDFRI